MSQGDRTRLRRIYPSYRQRQIPVDFDGGGGTVILSGNMGGDPDATYVVMSLTSSLSNERQLTMGSGLLMNDGGPNAAVTLYVDNNIVATTSGSTFLKLSGSLQRTSAGLSYLTGIGGTTVTSQSNGQIFISSSAPTSPGADKLASFIVVATTSSLDNERALTAGGGVTLTDAGAGGNITLGINNSIIATVSGTTFSQLSGSLQRLSSGITYLAGQGGASVTTSSNGQVVVSASIDAPQSAQYLTLAADAVLSSERVFTPGTGISSTDGGAGGNYTVAINNNVVATVSGTTFTGVVSASAGLSGSLQQVGPNLPYLLSQGGITITTLSNGQIIISGASGGGGGSGAPTTAQYLTLATDATLTAERVFTPGTGLSATDGGANGNYTLGINNNVVATTSGSTFTQLSGSLQRTSNGLSYIVASPGVTVNSGTAGSSTSQIFIGVDDRVVATVSGTTFTGVVSASAGLSGSLQQVGPGLPYLLSQGGITITTLSNGQIILSGVTATGGSGAPTSAQYLTLATDATLSAERVFTPGTGLTATDGGANGNYILAINNNVVATVSGSTFTQLSGSLQKTSAGLSYLVASPGVTVNSGTAGSSTSQIFIGVDNNVVATVSGSTFTQLSGSLQRTSNGLSYLVGGSGITVVSGTASSAGQVVFGFDDRVIAGVSGSTFTQLSGSLQKTAAGLSYLVGVGSVSITSQSNGQIIISGSGGSSGGGGDPGATYIVVSNTASLPNARTIAAGNGITITDAGAGSPITISANSTTSSLARVRYHTTLYNPVALWQLSGSVNDISGNGFHLTIGGTERYSELWPGMLGYAFDGSSGLSRTVTDTLLLITGAMTVECIMRLDVRPTADAVVFAMDASGESLATNYLYTTYISANSCAPQYFAENGAGNNISFTAPSAVQLGEIIHFAMVRDATSNVRYYINGDPAGSGSSGLGTPAFSTPTQTFKIAGETSIAGSRFIGSIASFKIISGTALTQAQIYDEFLNTIGPIYSLGVSANTGTWQDAGNKLFTTASVSVDSQGRNASQLGNDVYFFASGTTGFAPNQTQRKVALFQGDVVVSGTISGSIHQTAGGLSYLVGAGGVSIISQSNGQILVSGVSSGAPASAQFLTLATETTLTAERVFTPGTGLSATDGGSGGNYTLNINNNVVATVSGTKFSGPVTASLGISGSHATFATSEPASSTGVIRLGGTSAVNQMTWFDGTSDTPLIKTELGGNGLEYGNAGHATNLYGSSLTLYAGASSVFLYAAAVERLRVEGAGVTLGGGSGDFGGGDKVNFVADAATTPTVTPTGGGIFYSEAGAGKWYGSGGTVTTFGPADPHCPTCGRDFATEHRNDALGEHFSICLPCMVDTIAAAGIDVSKFAIVDKRSANKAQWDENHRKAKKKREMNKQK